MFIFLLSTCIQNFSNWHALFDFFITFCSRCGTKWDTACRPTYDPFWAFLSPGAQELVQPPDQYLFSLDSWKKIDFGHSSEKDNYPGFLSQQGFVLQSKTWDELGVTWQTKQRFSFAILGASNFKHFKQLFMILSRLGLLTVREFSRRVSFFVSSFL